MKSKLSIGIGFVTGRANVCDVINNYYSYILEQMKKYYVNVEIVFYILYDLEYQGAKREDFYKLKPELFKTDGIKVKYITPDDIKNKKVEVQDIYKLSSDDVDLILGNGHAKGRNTLMYFAYRDNMDYLLFWDDDEYPVACVKNDDGSIDWRMQDNVVKHIEYMEDNDADVTIGYHCGYISPIPYMEFKNEEEEEKISNFIEAIGNELVSWKSVKEKFITNNGVTYADPKIVKGEGGFMMDPDKGQRFLAGSTLCINLSHIDKIPAFYNPPGARGEDTFFSLGLQDDAKVMKVPVYHFHDGFLKCRSIMQYDFPAKLKLIKSSEDTTVEKRFFKACLGWIKYKPLYTYLLDKETYEKKMAVVTRKMKNSIKKIDSFYDDEYDFNKVLDALEEYDEKVLEHYQTYIKTNHVWDELKMKFK